jgi:hypothetical protein
VPLIGAVVCAVAAFTLVGWALRGVAEDWFL